MTTMMTMMMTTIRQRKEKPLSFHGWKAIKMEK